MQHDDQLLAQRTHNVTEQTNTLLATDLQRSVLRAITDVEQLDTVYAPYGHTTALRANQVLGFNGERADPMTGHYLLGNGYRAFNPILMRFNSPDSLSPFGKGGINCYNYCLDDPINNQDPSGHFKSRVSSLFAIAGIASSLGGIFSALSGPARTSGPAFIAYATGALGVLYGGVASTMPGTRFGEIMAGSSSALGAISMTMGARASRSGRQRHSSLESLNSMESALELPYRFIRPPPPPPYQPPLSNFISASGSSRPSPPRYFQGLAIDIPRGSLGTPPEYTPINQARELTTPQRVTVKISKLPEVHTTASKKIRETAL
ncbi:RHS repeat-associated core domain-containing protein [Pseudomonas sp. SIMBA_077]